MINFLFRLNLVEIISQLNNINNSNWTYKKSGNGNNTLLINSNPYSKDTNFGHIQLDKGANDIAITGADGSDITFSFPFVYIA